MNELPTELHYQICGYLRDGVKFPSTIEGNISLTRNASKHLTALFNLGLTSHYYHAIAMPMVQDGLFGFLRCVLSKNRRLPCVESFPESNNVAMQVKRLYTYTLWICTLPSNFRSLVMRNTLPLEEEIRLPYDAHFGSPDGYFRRLLVHGDAKIDPIPFNLLKAPYHRQFGRRARIFDSLGTKEKVLGRRPGSLSLDGLKENAALDGTVQGLYYGEAPALMCLLRAFDPSAVKLSFDRVSPQEVVMELVI
ncbi:uncharacterized protein KY384_000785 [Bacidia gigantensis]|uniref:uncharacterized protein n=1 Tax=Bacidia gigantensis TaxID=2732470 RepID=UPI001D05A2B7|nr:uncharacterized protein KY384_000785 [Bacidia gigantensis]KAG8526023.1 hypothetical protein KY384_000785 [Bacidia gigantensis]